MRTRIETRLARRGRAESSARRYKIQVPYCRTSKNYDLKTVDPHAKNHEDTRSPEKLLDLIEAKGREVAEALAIQRTKGKR